MVNEFSAGGRQSPRRLFVFSLAIAYFATATLDTFLSLLLVDIASTFQATLGATSQIRTFSSFTAVVVALSMGILSVRFKHKSLIIVGVLCMLFSGLGCFFAPSLNWMYLFYSLQGIASVIVFPMALTLIGDIIPLEKRANTVSILLAVSPLSIFIVIPLTGAIAGSLGWRYVPLLFAVPVSVVGLFFAHFGVPSISPERTVAINKETYLRRFKQVLSNTSAKACLVGNIFRTSTYVAIELFAISFYIQRFLVTIDLGVGIMMGGSLLFTLGTLAAGHLSNQFGRRRVTVLTSFIAGVFVMSLFQMPMFGMALPFDYLAIFFSGIAFSAATSLTLEQVPKARSTMMSLNTAVIALGMALVPIIGGALLDLFSYEAMGLTLGAMGIAAAFVFYFLSKDQAESQNANKIQPI